MNLCKHQKLNEYHLNSVPLLRNTYDHLLKRLGKNVIVIIAANLAMLEEYRKALLRVP